MRVFFDQGVPVPLRTLLTAHEVDTAYEKGWSALENGELLSRVEEDGYAVFVTTDKNLQYQQNLAGHRVAIIVLPTPSWPRLREMQTAVVAVLDKIAPGDFVEVQES